MRGGSQRLFLAIAWWGGLAWLALLFVVCIADGWLREFFFNSDNLYIPSLVEDLVRWGGNLKDWNCPPAPYFFPDALVYAVARVLSPSIEGAAYLAGLTQFLLIVVAGRAVLQRALPAVTQGGALLAPIFVLWFLAWRWQWIATLAGALVINVHGGAVLAHVALLALCLQTSRPVVLVAACGLAFVAGFSDPLFVASSAAPLLALALAATLSRNPSARRIIDPIPASARTCVLAAMSGILGVVALRSTIGGASSAYTRGTWPRFLATAKVFWDTADSTVWRVIAFVVGCAVVGCIALFRCRDRTAKAGLLALILWEVTSLVSTLGAMFASGAYLDVFSVRYFVVSTHFTLVLVCGILLLPYKASGPQAERLTRLSQLVSIAVVLGLVVTIVSQATSLVSGQYASTSRSTARCFADLAARENITTVLSEYWQAKPFTLLSKRRVNVLQVDSKLNPRWWINSKGWYRGEHRFGLVSVKGLDSKRLRKRFGPPQSVEHCADFEIWIYRGAARERFSEGARSQFAAFAATK